MDIDPKTGKRWHWLDLEKMALKHGLIEEKEVDHSSHFYESKLWQRTANLRHKMWGRGESPLSTEVWKPRDAPEPWMEGFRNDMEQMFRDRRGG